jgi:hypothetical protein
VLSNQQTSRHIADQAMEYVVTLKAIGQVEGHSLDSTCRLDMREAQLFIGHESVIVELDPPKVARKTQPVRTRIEPCSERHSRVHATVENRPLDQLVCRSDMERRYKGLLGSCRGGEEILASPSGEPGRLRVVQNPIVACAFVRKTCRQDQSLIVGKVAGISVGHKLYESTRALRIHAGFRSRAGIGLLTGPPARSAP